MDDKRNRNKMFADTNESGYVWTGPYITVPKIFDQLICSILTVPLFNSSTF